MPYRTIESRMKCTCHRLEYHEEQQGNNRQNNRCIAQYPVVIHYDQHTIGQHCNDCQAENPNYRYFSKSTSESSDEGPIAGAVIFLIPQHTNCIHHSGLCSTDTGSSAFRKVVYHKRKREYILCCVGWINHSLLWLCPRLCKSSEPVEDMYK